MRTGTGASSKRRSCSMLNEVVELVAADLRRNQVDSDQLPLLIETVRQSLVGLGQSHVGPQPPIPAVPARRRIAADAPIRLKCGAIVRTLRRHLLTVDNSRPGHLWDENGTHRVSIGLQRPITFSCAASLPWHPDWASALNAIGDKPMPKSRAAASEVEGGTVPVSRCRPKP